MGTGDYICVTMSGGAPWGFRLQGGKEQKQPLQVSKVRKKSKACRAGLCEGDEVVSINGKPCCDLTHTEAMTIVDSMEDTLQIFIKRSSNGMTENLESSEPDTEAADCGKIKNKDYVESTTLQIRAARQALPRELYISESQDEAYYGETESDTDVLGAKQEKQKTINPWPSPQESGSRRERLMYDTASVEEKEEIKQGTLVELQLSLSRDSVGNASAAAFTVLGTQQCVPSDQDPKVQYDETGQNWESEAPEDRVRKEAVHWATKSIQIASAREGAEVQGAEAKDPSLARVQVILDCSDREKETIGSLASSGCVDSQVEGGYSEEAPPSAVFFGISSEGTEQGAEQQHSERDHIRPHKHRARHARLRRSESLSEKQVKEAKSKCKRIALLLTAAPNPNSKGVLMFKKRRQRAKKYTLVSYGTGELEQEEEEGDEEDTFEITLVGTSDSEIDEDFFSDANNTAQIVTFDWDTDLLEVERKVKSEDEMERLPETKGKGALMFAKRRQRIDQLTAEQDEMRRLGIPVEEPREATIAESIKTESSYHTKENSYVESSVRTQSQVNERYIEVNHQQSPVTGIQNGIGGGPAIVGTFQSTETQKSIVTNRMPRPFPGVQNRAAVPFSSVQGVASPISDLPAPPLYSSLSPPPEPMYRVVSPPVATKANTAVWSPTGSMEQIASRDERISVPAKRTGILQETRKRNTSKPMFTFKEPPKVCPNPALLSLVQRKETKRGQPGAGGGFESGPEEDYLSLGAEACNFMHTAAAKQKTPPPVAPKPSIKPSPSAITPVSPPWSPPAEAASQPLVFPSQNTTPQVTVPQPVSIAQPVNSLYPPSATLNLAATPATQGAASGQIYTSKTPPSTPVANTAPAGGVGPAYEMPALKGRGAELFARRQSRMEKFVVDSAAVQANKARSASPTPSLPASWKYSPNVRAPPPLAYNPIHSPFYPPAAAKIAAKSSSAAAAATSTKTSTKGKSTTKVLNALDVFKHQPYQLNSALFTFQPTDTKAPLPKGAPIPRQPIKFEPMPPVKPAQPSRPLSETYHGTVRAQPVSTGPVYSSTPLPQPGANALFHSSVSMATNETHTAPSYPMFSKQEPTTSTLIKVPRPKFSAKKAGVAAQVWKPAASEE
ncbi:synaptopodin-2 isoform X1 [Latimeria chalumnae]|uniref:synaptopodin-2 isoform X1 n=2 Tax=Latimeria chalumnae TaxID=7897 RepID=UPI0003C1390B|nr:PREDICTED: synaptopodin-2 [Latimeria chalumnae]|eukprot:XP_006004582.1 PREDICTED: synaptopodin-2 [Latimeria chalumnae]